MHEAPAAALTAHDVGRHVMVVVKLTGQKLGFHLGKLTKHVTAPRFKALYNFDVQFASEKGARGIKLETDGAICTYDAAAKSNADEGTWFFVEKSE